MYTISVEKTLTAGLLSVTLAATSILPTTASARMSDEEAVVGFLALLAIGAAIHNNRNSDPQPSQPAANNGWRVLPADCRRDIQTRRQGTTRMFTQNCLSNNYNHMNRLPQNCRVDVRANNGQQVRGYEARCLSNAGFRTNQR